MEAAQPSVVRGVMVENGVAKRPDSTTPYGRYTGTVAARATGVRHATVRVLTVPNIPQPPTPPPFFGLVVAPLHRATVSGPHPQARRRPAKGAGSRPCRDGREHRAVK